MSKIIFIGTIVLLTFCSLQAQEFRGTWVARNSLSTKASIAATMDSLAANNFNVVFINVWSQGYPLWKSNVFFQHTGIYTDPTYGGRDILAETIAEAHKHGLFVEAWFEYGFVGGYSGRMPVGEKGPIFNAHPDWVEKKNDGTEIDGNNFYWMIHTHPDVQNFLIAMASEVARNYDVDGIELDRIRYSALTYGYDTYTVNLYKSENGGSSPPANTADTSWIRWRAEKLNLFVARAYDTIKSIDQNINVSNAPGHYSSSSYSAYNSYCQDWLWWVNNNKVDNVQIQMYVASASTFSSYINWVLPRVNNDLKVYPSFAIKPSGNTISDATLTSMINNTKTPGLKGNAIWYYNDLLEKFTYIKNNHYSAKSDVPHAPAGWRNNISITAINNATDAVRTGTWLNSSLTGYSGNSIYANNSALAAIDYYCTVPEAGYYEVYAFCVISSNRTAAAQYSVYSATGTTTKYVDQSNVLNDRWYKLGDFYFNSGRSRVVRLTNNGLSSDKFLSADAVFLKMNRKLTSANPLPVELFSFKAERINNTVELFWTTSNEVSNFGWDIERSFNSITWQKIGFMPGHGNSNSMKNYSFKDIPGINEGKIFYRLKQYDSDGKAEYSGIVSVEWSDKNDSYLFQNYPNPFGLASTAGVSATEIKFLLPKKYNIKLKIFNAIGEVVKDCLSGEREAGLHSFIFDSGNLATGMYFAELKTDEFRQVKKMLLLK